MRFCDGEDFDDIFNFVLSNQPKLNNDNFESSLIGDGVEEDTGAMKETINDEVEQFKNEKRRGRPCSGPPSKTVLKKRRHVGFAKYLTKASHTHFHTLGIHIQTEF